MLQSHTLSSSRVPRNLKAKSNQQLSSQPLAKPQYDFNNTNHQQQSHITTTSCLSLEQAIASRLPSAKIKKATDAHPDSTDVVEAEGSEASYGLLRIGDISGMLWLPLSLAGFGILLSEYIFVPCSPTRTLPGEVE
ncbi:hypothetical protein PILCRDRAFT_12521 [Piloderma croceum F 1598]|uniref:Uncharacterized protein n=1 Tax=Piloderma croceum (strain F 1598) TaxID=765440 RepID=A0A0C3EWC0_PILCF|nr:hypothetical protein PILCRDRAFT_12521 [Piloderma croceum F 1598]